MDDKIYRIEGAVNGAFLLDYITEINYAMCVNLAAAIVRCTLSNNDLNPWASVRITLSGEMLTLQTVRLDGVEAGQTVDLTDSLSIIPTLDKMVSLQEAIDTTMNVTVTVGDSEALNLTLPLHLMPYDQWTGARLHPELLASFVTPNHPIISRIIVKASQYMQQWTGNSAMDEYQSCDPNRVRYQVAAIYEALRGEGLVYVTPPASFETDGQRVRMSDKVLNEKLGTCLDLTLLYASCLEAVGIRPMIVLVKGHSIVGAWLAHHDNCMVGDDASILLKSTADGINELVLVEATALTSQAPVTFDQAVAMAMSHVRDEQNLDCFINIDDCRLNNIRPLPVRVYQDGNWVIINDSEGHENATTSVRNYDTYDLSAYDQSTAKVTKYTIWERKLLDFSLRNNLLNMKLGKKIVPLVSFQIDRLEDFLQAGQAFKVLPFPIEGNAKVSNNGIHDSSAYPQLEEIVVNGLENKRIYSFHHEDELREALKYAYRAARTSMEENGASNLYLVLGALKWYESERSQQPRLAPILLLPIEIKYAGNRSTYEIRTRDEEIVLNITLSELLKQQHDIDLSVLNELPKDHSGVDVKKIFAIIRDKIRNKRGWNVLDESMIGLFSFSKFVMWNDIHSNAPQLHQHPIISSLVEGKLNLTNEHPQTDAKAADAMHRPADYSIPIDVDSSQLEAIIDSGEGHSFILHGPPGTGKSQTITNIIANALYQGKRVLFVAEKMAALSVVQSRLQKIGLEPFCLELHSNKVTKQHFLGQMDLALNVAHTRSPQDYQLDSEQLYTERQKLIAYVDALHRKRDNGMSLYDYITLHLSTDADHIRLDANDFASATRRDIDEMAEQLMALDTIIKITGDPSTSPLKGLDILDTGGSTEATLSKHMHEAVRAINDLTAMRGHEPLLEMCHEPERLDEINRAMDAGKRRMEIRRQLKRDYNTLVYNADLNKFMDEWATANAKWFVPRYFAKRALLKRYNITANDIPGISEANDIMNECSETVDRYKYVLRDLLGDFVWSDTGEADRLLDAANTVRDHFSAIRSVANINVKHREIPEALKRWADNEQALRDWYHWCKAQRELREKHLEPVVEYIMSGGKSAADAAEAFVKSVSYAMARHIIAHDDALRHFNGLIFEETIQRYRSITARFQELSKKELFSRLAARIPSMAMAAHDTSEVGILKRNIKNGGRGTSIRKIIDQIPTLLPKLCPCMLMSPLSVAQYIDLKNAPFDLVIFDEASQMPTSEAVGAIARGKALIVVGDPKQMPPTSFFSTSAVGEDEAYIDDMESILDDCISLSIPSRYLTWHYRSKHESLIAFSNSQYYEGRLYTFPSVDDRQRKVTLREIEGVYDKGRSRSNITEAKAVVDEVIRRLKDPELSKRSIGIVSFSKVQQDKIEDMLNDELAKYPELEAIAYEGEEPIFVKNLENVQGDERDVILFSVGYGPDKSGKVSMNFGPLNNAGGERRLNVAVSRARYEMVVFSSLKPEQIDLRRTNALGVEGLKKFLEFAQTGRTLVPSEQAAAQGTEYIALEIAAELAKHGYKTQLGVGRSKFKVDVAVIHPKRDNQFVLGILCDGTGYYHTKTMRDREIVQPTVLRLLNWEVVRVWTLDWFERKDKVVEALLKRLEEVANRDPNTPLPQIVETPVIEDDIIEDEEIIATTPAKPYVIATDIEDAPYDNSIASMLSNMKLIRRQLQKMIEVEQPIVKGLLYKRLVRHWGLRHGSQKVQMILNEALRGMKVHVTEDGNTYWMDKAAEEAFTGYRNNSDREATEIPLVEAVNALNFVMEQQCGIGRDDLKRLAAQQLGFARVGTNVSALMDAALHAF